jgi:hypothetical protein
VEKFGRLDIVVRMRAFAPAGGLGIGLPRYWIKDER